MRVTITQQAGEHARFAPDSWDRQIGKTVPFKAPGVETTATVVAAEVSPDGASVALTLDVQGDVPSRSFDNAAAG